MRKHQVVYNLFTLSIFLVTMVIVYPLGIEAFEKLSQYGVHFVFFLIMIAMIFLIVNLRRLMFTSLLCAALLCVFLKRHSNYNLVLPQENLEPSINVAHINLSNVNGDETLFLSILENIEAEVISFQEYTPYWESLLSTFLKDSYPSAVEITRIDPYGVALFSKISFTDVDTTFTSDAPYLRCSMKINDGIIDVHASYISPSLDNSSNTKAHNQLAAITNHIRMRKNPSIVIGEFNDVYWSNKIRTFRANNLLLNSRRNITPSSFDVPHDHIFFSNDLECTLFKNIEDASGNRIGIYGRYQFKVLSQNEIIRASFGLKS